MAETIPGGYYLGPNGKPHDANGREIAKKSDRALKTARGKAAELTEEQKAALAEQHAAEQRALEAQEASEKADAAVDDAAAGVKAADKQAKQQQKEQAKGGR
jgi:hypothetical protein